MTTFVAGSIVLILLAAGLIRLFAIRFESGDVYPPYSSLRYDPLGTRAFFDSLSACDGITVERNFKPIERLERNADTALLYIGESDLALYSWARIPRETAAAANAFIRAGGRVVITFLPRNAGVLRKAATEFADEYEEDELDDGRDTGRNTEKKTAPRKDKEKGISRDPTTKGGDGKEKSKKDRGKDEVKESLKRHAPLAGYINATVAISEWLGMGFHEKPLAANASAVLNEAYGTSNLPATVSCHTSLAFTNVSAAWRVVYRRGADPVVVERQIGKGSLVVSTLSYFLSNEAMRKERHPALLAWLIGDKKHIVFDENHFGVEEQNGLALMARKYNLQWVLLAFLVLAILFVWQRTSSILPSYDAPPDSGTAELASGRDSTAGLVNLLRRSIPAGQILETCFAEWGKTQRQKDKQAVKRVQAVHELLTRRQDAGGRSMTPAETYNDVCRLLKKDT
ncbi:MAG: hypothetical protein C0404_12495 [Verrucomicrobia bacterium]|nr:hypothetical protein [Verrucomicrobiota bacterium]